MAQQKLVKEGLDTDRSALEKWRPLFAAELADVDNVILDMTKSETTLITKLVTHIISSGGKRLRPIMTILSSKLCGYTGDRHINLAAAIEFLHTATLLHDDVVDGSKLRRGVLTANNVWGNAPSVLVGDFLLSRAFQIMACDGSLEVLRILSDTSAIITEGEVKQLMAANNIHIDEEVYVSIISAKTAQLFSAACQIGAVISEKSQEESEALACFGLNFGIAFQIADDALDYEADQEKFGKAVGNDFKEGKVTLPVILTCIKGSDEEKKFWERVISGKQNNDDLDKAISLIKKHDVLKDTIDKAEQYLQKAEEALDIFPDSEAKTSLLDILKFSVKRSY